MNIDFRYPEIRGFTNKYESIYYSIPIDMIKLRSEAEDQIWRMIESNSSNKWGARSEAAG